MLGSGPEEGGRFRTQLIQLHMSGVISRMYGLVKLIQPLAAIHPIKECFIRKRLTIDLSSDMGQRGT